MDLLWRRCSVLCRMYERGKEVVREWLWQPGLSRAPRLGFQTPTVPTQQLSRYGYCSKKEEESAGFKNDLAEVSSPPHWHGQMMSDPPPRVTEHVFFCLPCVCGPCVYRVDHLHCIGGENLLIERCLGRCVCEGVCQGCTCGAWGWGRLWDLEWQVVGTVVGGYEVGGFGYVGVNVMGWKEGEVTGRGVRWWQRLRRWWPHIDLPCALLCFIKPILGNCYGPVCVSRLLCFMTRYWGILTVPGFPHERANGTYTHDSFSQVYLLNLSSSETWGG